MKRKSKILKKASSSKMMDITIALGSKKIRFNLHEELVIDENLIDEEILSQPSYYGYLGILKVKLQRKVNDLVLEVDKNYASQYFKEKDKLVNVSNKAAAEKMAKHKVEMHTDYLAICHKLNQAREQVGIISIALESFDQRSRMIQTISANRRKEIN